MRRAHGHNLDPAAGGSGDHRDPARGSDGGDRSGSVGPGRAGRLGVRLRAPSGRPAHHVDVHHLDGDHGGVDDAVRRWHRLPRGGRQEAAQAQAGVHRGDRADRGVRVHDGRRDRVHLLLVDPGDLRRGVREQGASGAPVGGGRNGVAVRHHRQPRERGDGDAGRAVGSGGVRDR